MTVPSPSHPRPPYQEPDAPPIRQFVTNTKISRPRQQIKTRRLSSCRHTSSWAIIGPPAPNSHILSPQFSFCLPHSFAALVFRSPPLVLASSISCLFLSLYARPFPVGRLPFASLLLRRVPLAPLAAMAHPVDPDNCVTLADGTPFVMAPGIPFALRSPQIDLHLLWCLLSRPSHERGANFNFAVSARERSFSAPNLCEEEHRLYFNLQGALRTVHFSPKPC
jgi:hypothetical protein